MGRLISEDNVMRMLTSVELNNGTITDAKSELRNVKTAYDISKVVAELEDLQCVNPFLTTTEYEHKAIEIARKGGAE